jgi:hypothetical protein|tara:strand:+ start:1008 stop:1244 length:237 start_codon:yes stop_codon:yes gene_type:complete
MNAIAALPSLAVAPRARVTRKSAAKNVAARAVRPDQDAALPYERDFPSAITPCGFDARPDGRTTARHIHRTRAFRSSD